PPAPKESHGSHDVATCTRLPCAVCAPVLPPSAAAQTPPRIRIETVGAASRLLGRGSTAASPTPATSNLFRVHGPRSCRRHGQDVRPRRHASGLRKSPTRQPAPAAPPLLPSNF